jgi:hypothetical protein
VRRILGARTIAITVSITRDRAEQVDYRMDAG